MAESLIEQLPKIVAEGKKEVERIMERLDSPNKITLQTNEYVLPIRKEANLFKGQYQNIDGQNWFNRLIYGDNLLVMQALLNGDEQTGMSSMRGKIDLIYIDPPYDSKADYRTKINLPGIELEKKPNVIEQFAYSDTWKEGTASYLKNLYPRLYLMKELLSNKGSIYVHLDWHVGHYVKILMDEIYGKDNFINEIVWEYRTGGIPEKLGYSKKHDSIFYYVKNRDEAIFNSQKEKQYLNAVGIGRQQGAWAQKMGIMLDENNKPYRYSFVRYVWNIPPLFNSSKERVGYPTQKPIELLSRIIEVSSNEDSIIADFYMGSGSFLSAANGMRIKREDGEIPVLYKKENTNRRWIGSDISKTATMITRKRLVDNEVEPFLYQAVGDYQKEVFASTKEFKRVGDLSQVVLNLFGATPFFDENSPKNLGQIKGTRTLVYVDSPNKMTGATTIKKAEELRESFMGGWSKVIILGWNFTFDIANILKDIDRNKLEVLVIPPDLMDKLKSKANFRKLIDSKKIKFSSLQYLTIKAPIINTYSCDIQEIQIELDNYVLLSPDALPLEDKYKEQLQSIVAQDPLALIEYWSIDPDFDGETFRSKWQDYRENTHNDNDPLRVITWAKIQTPYKAHRKICIKAVDVFGFESVVIKEL